MGRGKKRQQMCFKTHLMSSLCLLPFYYRFPLLIWNIHWLFSSLRHGFQHIFVPVPGTLCSVKSFSDVEHWPEAKLGQVHSNKFQRRLHEQCQSCLHMIGGSLVLVFQRAWAFRVLNCSGFSVLFQVWVRIWEKKKKSLTFHKFVRREKWDAHGFAEQNKVCKLQCVFSASPSLTTIFRCFFFWLCPCNDF